MSEVNQKHINDLADFEYMIRKGMVFTIEQQTELKAICEAIINDLED
jgi:hypothetical protein